MPRNADETLPQRVVGWENLPVTAKSVSTDDTVTVTTVVGMSDPVPTLIPTTVASLPPAFVVGAQAQRNAYTIKRVLDVEIGTSGAEASWLLGEFGWRDDINLWACSPDTFTGLVQLPPSLLTALIEGLRDARRRDCDFYSGPLHLGANRSTARKPKPLTAGELARRAADLVQATADMPLEELTRQLTALQDDLAEVRQAMTAAKVAIDCAMAVLRDRTQESA